MQKLIVMGFVGLLAQLIDGALGMAYGVTSTTLLLSTGVAPAAASATVHLAEIGTTLASGVTHWRFGNVDWRVVGLMTVPGGIGAFFGAVVLSSLSAEVAEPVIATFLFALGLYILIRFATRRFPPHAGQGRRLPAFFLSPLGAFAGFMDAAGGGGWGPIGTPALLSSGRMAPRKVVGSVDAGEFLVALGASIGFLVSLSFAELQLAWVGALLGGGLIAAPVAAWLVRKLPARILGSAVGGVILLTNARTFAEAMGAEGGVAWVGYAALAAIAVLAITSAVLIHRREQVLAPQAG
ncbi:MAG: sulfite exporter TauE/SafE family protein [Solirubrobacterales bacterium]